MGYATTVTAANARTPKPSRTPRARDNLLASLTILEVSAWLPSSFRRKAYNGLRNRDRDRLDRPPAGPSSRARLGRRKGDRGGAGLRRGRRVGVRLRSGVVDRP